MSRSMFCMCWLVLACINLSAQSTLRGTVTDTDGQPLAGANVLLSNSGRGVATDTEGTFRFEGLSAGTHRLQVTYIGYEPLEQEVLLPQDKQTVTLDLTLSSRSLFIDELIVSATRADATTPMTYTTLDKEAIEANNLGQDVPYLLRWTPSTVVTSDAGAGIGYTGIRIRGTDPTRINVTINGIPLNDAESQGVFWVDLPDFISSTTDVQIQRGVGTSTNGAGAFGATINLNTAERNEEPYVETNASVGSFNTLKGNIEFGSGTLGSGFSLDGRLSRITSDGYIDRASADLDSWYLSGAYHGRSSVLRFNAFSGHEVTYQAWNGVDPSLVDDPDTRTTNTAGTGKAGEPYDNEVDDYRQTHYQLLYDQQLSAQWDASLGLHYTRGAGFFEQYKADQTLLDYGITPADEQFSSSDLIRRRWLDNDFYGTVYALRYRQPAGRWKLTLGGGYHFYDGRHFGEVIWARHAGDSEIRHPYYDNDADKRDFNIYGKWNYALRPDLNVFVDLQWRRVGYDFQGINNRGENVPAGDELNFFNPKAGIFYQPNTRTEVYASFAVANREPNRNDYTENPVGQWPRPERLLNTEAGLRYRWDRAALGGNIYHMYYQDQLTLNGQINDVGEYTRINVPQSYRLGIELVGGIELSPRLQWTANATLSRNKVSAFTEYVDTYDADFNWLEQTPVAHEETDLAFSPELIAGSELSYVIIPEGGRHDLEAALLTKYVGRQYIDNTSDPDNALDSYWFSDLRLQYRLRGSFLREIGFTLLVQNLFDRLYETNGWSYRYLLDGDTFIQQGLYPQAGRNFLLGVSVRF